jgi:hypothetical protein
LFILFLATARVPFDGKQGNGDSKLSKRGERPQSTKRSFEFLTPEGREFGAYQRMETMALKGKPRDMNKWREVLLDPNVHFPGESSEYRRTRNELLEAEAELQRQSEQVAARRALPAGGLIREDYVFESAADGSAVKFSELFAPGKNSLVIDTMMFPRWSEDARAGAPGGKTAELPLVDQPCPSCTSVVDGLKGAAFHLAERINLVVIAKTSPERLGTYAQEHGWHNLRLLSSEQHLQPRLPCGNSGGCAARGPERVLTRRGWSPPPLGERERVQARQHQPPRSDLVHLRRSRFDAGGTRRHRWLSQPAVLKSSRKQEDKYLNMTDATSENFDRAICARAVSERVFLAGAALLFAATAAATIVWCNAMRAVGGMAMADGWTMSMAWMRMPGQSWARAASSFVGKGLRIRDLSLRPFDEKRARHRCAGAHYSISAIPTFRRSGLQK